MITTGMLARRLGVVGLALAGANPAFAAQCANVSFSPTSVVVPDWNPITPAAQLASFTMTVTRLNSATTGIRLMFVDSNDQSQPVYLGSNGTQSGPRYQLLDPSGQNIVYPKNSSVTSLKGQPAMSWQNKNSNNSQSATYRLAVPANTPGTDYRSGPYGETLNYAIQCLNNGNDTNLIDGPLVAVAMSLTIPNLVMLTTASAATLDFQNFTSSTQRLSVGVKSTGPVNVAIDSSNKLQLVRAGVPAPYPDNSKITYAMSLNGITVAALPTTLTNQLRAGVSGSAWPLVLSLPTMPSGKVAGSYSDTITLTLTPGG